MLFNSLEFAIFLPIVFVIYWFLERKGINYQNAFILIASYFFYGWWDWKFLLLIFFSTILDFFLAKAIYSSQRKKTKWIYLLTSLIFNLGLLIFFKYYNFFLDNFIDLFTIFGQRFDYERIKIILPVGISFYTFQTLSYTIDVYKGKLKPENSFVNFASFVSFFPQLVAGPIERAIHLLPQFKTKRIFNYQNAVDGCRQILWGLFKKIVVADTCANSVNFIFSNHHEYSSLTLIAGAVLFAFQIYGDFSGYSDIAIGTARLFGFDLMKNFSFPYFSRDIAEFWRRWHISLSTWFRDYLYIPLGGSKVSKIKQIRNTFIIFLVSGFWHGANWTFIVWGLINAIYFLPLLLLNANRKNQNIVAENSIIPNLKDVLSIIGTFTLTTLAWIFFRAQDIRHAIEYIVNIFTKPIQGPQYLPINIFFIIISFTIIEWLGKENNYALEKIGLKWKKQYRHLFYYSLIIAILINAGEEKQFIYFQF